MKQQSAPIPTMALRMDDDLRERLEDAAAKNGRNLSAEIRSRLEESFLPLGGDAETNRAVRYLAIGAIAVRHAYGTSWRQSRFLARVMLTLAADVFQAEPGASDQPPGEPSDVLAIILDTPLLRDRAKDDPATIALALQMAWAAMERGTPLSRGYDAPIGAY